MKLTDGKHTLEISMKVWDNNTECWDFGGMDLADEFFEVGGLVQDDNGAYIVPDVDYCVDMAHEWEKCEGDFSDDYARPGTERIVFVG